MRNIYSGFRAIGRTGTILSLLAALGGCQGMVLPVNPPTAQALAEPPPASLPPLQKPGEPYTTPRSGEGFQTEVFGRAVEVPARDLRSISAWDLGISGSPGLEQSEVLPFGAIYLWRRPDEDHLLRATVVGLFNDASYAYSPENFGPFESVFSFENFTVPFDQSEFIDGERIQREELTWGYVRTGFGLGYRDNLPNGSPSNMRALSLSLEPGYLYFGGGADAADDFETPNSTLETRLHLQARWDALERNLLELAHEGFAAGADLVTAHRNHWDDWGRGGK